MHIDPLILTFKLALVTTIILFFVALPVSYWLANTKSWIKPLAETLVSMPLVLPPTVIGFYLLLTFSPESAFGTWLENWFGIRLVFTFEGLVVASLVYSLPFMVQPIQAGLSALPKSYKEASYVLGKSRWTTFWKVLLPSIKRSVLSGIVLTFAHTIGEFGIVLMIGGNIPGKTKVASIAIYDEVETMNYAVANNYAFILLGVTFIILLLVYTINGSDLKNRVRW